MVTEIRKLMHKVDQQFSAVNCGGCCVVAAAIAQQLHDKKVPVKIRVLVWGADTADSVSAHRIAGQLRNNSKRLLSNDEWRLEFNHVVAEIKWQGRTYIIDTARGCTVASKYLQETRFIAYKGQLTQAEALFLANDAEGWCETFNRNQIPDMRKMIASGMSSI